MTYNCQEFKFLRVSLSSLDLTVNVTIFQGKGSYSEFPLSLQFLIDNFMTLLNLREKHIKKTKNFYQSFF